MCERTGIDWTNNLDSSRLFVRLFFCTCYNYSIQCYVPIGCTKSQNGFITSTIISVTRERNWKRRDHFGVTVPCQLKAKSFDNVREKTQLGLENCVVRLHNVNPMQTRLRSIFVIKFASKRRLFI